MFVSGFAFTADDHASEHVAIALISTRRDPVRGAALLNEARAGFEAKGMKDHVDETDRMMKAAGVKRH